ncbi:MauE/DoxX family redox-associated membrane protein [Flexivirga oryzae]|uniref:Putative membrane protein YphA (DoxX/SURF4 family) n=1 Tax=Flexivirga oryzae TaxID=1794944 RepID=A0A839MZK1_9MICO|nr:putative membrane protein YphA (DoxX/SURF4 family) [Flexivirga oryzae]
MAEQIDSASPGVATRVPWQQHPAMEWIGLAARLILGVTYLVAGILKARQLEVTQMDTRAFRILPYDLANIWGAVMPFVEIIFGLLLIAGLMTRMTAVLGGLLMIAFIIGISSVWARGIVIQCGCFGNSGKLPTTAAYKWDILRDVGLLLCAAWLVVWPRTRLSADRALWG